MSESDALSSQARQAERLKKARISAGYPNATAAAEALGVNDRTYAQHENGKRGYRRNAKKYAEKYDTSIDWLLFGDDTNASRTAAPQQNTALNDAISRLLSTDTEDLYNPELLEYSFQKAVEFDKDLFNGQGSVETVLEIAKKIYKLTSLKNQKTDNN
ncbi:helix-turn-helix domain-containing protein [Roseibium alexandrii]